MSWRLKLGGCKRYLSLEMKNGEREDEPKLRFSEVSRGDLLLPPDGLYRREGDVTSDGHCRGDVLALLCRDIFGMALYKGRHI